jgi:hypothetical protein
MRESYELLSSAIRDLGNDSHLTGLIDVTAASDPFSGQFECVLKPLVERQTAAIFEHVVNIRLIFFPQRSQ